MLTIRFFRLLPLFLLINVLAFAQQKPHYTQYILNNYILNPALSGIENYVDVKFSHRHQWVGLQDAPVTTYFTIQGPIGKKDYKTNATTLFEVPGDNPRGNDYWQNYEASAPHHGIGMQIINDRTGAFNNFSAFATYAYHMGVGKKTNLSAGIGLGVSKLSLDPGKLNFGTSQPNDPSVFGNDEISASRMDMNAGLWLYSDKYFVGLAANQLIPHKLDFSDGQLIVTEKGKMVPHIFATAGYRLLLNEDINLIPSVMVKSIGSLPIQLDINAKAQFRDFLLIGASYRAKYGFAGMAGINILSGLTISYSYDYSTTQINTVSQGTHEVVLGFIIGNKYNSDTCPKNVW
ncbi:type IX secretion system membrane protein PorP/SprF [Ferruginibacter lapsinanis]|uniref:PorP/SprF family type IX secretion system membrane protein n=1 Tax=Ferruginibacter lapsinanis TaxID=563172 RepID=UPI001E4D829C|nr:type IX secretion system membrane protein PorP/SprF [Ferruginibacter lapsinanis]UEG49092.1 type IX secretion system membrane protein PorP/SprF [Ferruginibacter lapsinanis]